MSVLNDAPDAPTRLRAYAPDAPNIYTRLTRLIRAQGFLRAQRAQYFYAPNAPHTRPKIFTRPTRPKKIYAPDAPKIFNAPDAPKIGDAPDAPKIFDASKIKVLIFNMPNILSFPNLWN